MVAIVFLMAPWWSSSRNNKGVKAHGRRGDGGEVGSAVRRMQGRPGQHMGLLLLLRQAGSGSRRSGSCVQIERGEGAAVGGLG